MKCRAQALGMMRQANAALRLLLRMQATRRKLEADDGARDRLAWSEHCAAALMTEALSRCPHPGPLPEREEAEGAPPRDEEEEATTVHSLAEGRGEGSQADLIAAAERYAALYPERAAQIRHAKRLPPEVRYFDPPEATLAAALIAGRSPALAALDNLPGVRAA